MGKRKINLLIECSSQNYNTQLLLLLNYFFFSSKYCGLISNERGENQSNVVDLKND